MCEKWNDRAKHDGHLVILQALDDERHLALMMLLLYGHCYEV